MRRKWMSIARSEGVNKIITMGGLTTQLKNWWWFNIFLKNSRKEIYFHKLYLIFNIWYLIFCCETLATKYIFTKLYFTKVFQQTELPNSPPTFKTCGFRFGVLAKGRRTFLLKLQYSIFAKYCLLTLVKSRLALRSLGCLFVRSFVTMPKMAKYTGKWLLLPPSGHIQSETLFSDHTRPGKRNEWSSQYLHSWHWVLFVMYLPNKLRVSLTTWPHSWKDGLELSFEGESENLDNHGVSFECLSD